jgi:hypothetical protein
MVLISLLFFIVCIMTHISLWRIHIVCVVLRSEITSIYRSLGFLFIHILLALKV